MWRVSATAPLPASGGTLQFGWGGRTRIDGDGTASEPPAGNGTASHFGDLAGRVRFEELVSGRINHALNIVINCDNGTFVAPARASDQRCSNVGLSDVNAPPMGSHFQLNMTPQQINALPVRRWKKVFLRAMAEYGMFMGDTGSRNLFSIETEAGNQYTSLGYPDPWWTFGQQQWELYIPTPGSTEYIGKLYNRPSPDPNDPENANLDWIANVWANLRVLQP
jgi:hypothetical protein